MKALKSPRLTPEQLSIIKAHDMTAEKTEAMKSAMENVIHCRFTAGTPLQASEPWEAHKSVSFIYAPDGISTITAGFRKDETITCCIEVNEGTAAALQESFDYVTATEGQEPYADEDHEAKKATLRFPIGKVKFSYGELKAHKGVIVTGPEPTSYGAESVNGKVYRSWSPEFATDAEYAKASCKKNHWTFPDGVRGSESNPAHIIALSFVTGALTNKPAFKNMPPVKAKKAELESDTLKASGTSEGVKKSWDVRRGELAGHFGEASVNRLSAHVFKHDPEKSRDFAKHASQHAEAASKLVSECEDGDKHFAHSIASNAHSEAAEAASHAGMFNYESHHRTQRELHSRYAHAANDSAHPDHGRALRFQATDATELENILKALDTTETADLMKASGTSEGVKKSWETRMHGIHKGLNDALDHLNKIEWSKHHNDDQKLGEHVDELRKHIDRAIGRTSTTSQHMRSLDQKNDKTEMVQVDGNDPVSWEEFCKQNSDSPEANAEIKKHLDSGKEYQGGGGAAAKFTVKKFMKTTNATPTPLETIFARRKAEQDRINGIASKSPTLAAREAAAAIPPNEKLEAIFARKESEHEFQNRILGKNPVAANREALEKIQSRVIA